MVMDGPNGYRQADKLAHDVSIEDAVLNKIFVVCLFW